MNNPYYIQPASESIASAGNIALGGLVDYRIRGQQQEQEKQRLMQEQQQKAESAEIIERIKNKSPEAIYDLMQSDPKLAESVMKGQKFVDQETKQSLVDGLMRYRLGEDVETMVMRQAQSVKAKGGDPSDTLRWGMMPKEQRDKMADIGIAMNATPEQWERYQQMSGNISAEKVQDFDIKRQTLEFRKLENKERSLDRQLKREDNDIKRHSLEQKMQENKRQINIAKNDQLANIESARGNIDNMLNTIDEAILTDDSTIEAATGPLSSRTLTISSDTADFEEIIKTIDAQAFLAQIPNMKGMGALSEAEGNKLAGALKNLSLRQSAPRLKKNLMEVQRLMVKGRENITRRYGVDETIPDTPSSAPSPQEIDELIKLYGGE